MCDICSQKKIPPWRYSFLFEDTQHEFSLLSCCLDPGKVSTNYCNATKIDAYRCDEVDLDNKPKPINTTWQTYNHAQKMQAAATYGFGRVYELGNILWQQSEVSGQWRGNPSILEVVSTYMVGLWHQKVHAGETPTSAWAITAVSSIHYTVGHSLTIHILSSRRCNFMIGIVLSPTAEAGDVGLVGDKCWIWHMQLLSLVSFKWIRSFELNTTTFVLTLSKMRSRLHWTTERQHNLEVWMKIFRAAVLTLKTRNTAICYSTATARDATSVSSESICTFHTNCRWTCLLQAGYVW